MLSEKIKKISKEVEKIHIKTKEELEFFKKKYGDEIKLLFDNLKDLDIENKRIIGPQLNNLKTHIDNFYKKIANELNKSTKSENNIDYSLHVGQKNTIGNKHTLTLVKERIIKILEKLGFYLAEGPEIETDWYNFTSLNVPQDHPARDSQDTFFITEDQSILLRTHTSGVQMRVLEKYNLPIKMISCGRCYRNEDISYRSHCMFHQIEGLYVDKNVSFVDLKNTLNYIFKNLFGEDIKMRFRPSFFPFTEPSTEVDISCIMCKGQGCPICKHTGWLEVCGAGMVDPNVLENAKIDHDIYSGFAFGFGIERLAMLMYGVDDIRFFTTNDVKFLKQFNI